MPEVAPAVRLDRQYFDTLLALDADEPGFLVQLLVEFEEGATRSLQAIEAAVRTGDRDALKFAAHSLRGSCATLGAQRMAAIAAELEKLPQARRAEGSTLGQRLATELGALRDLLAEKVPGASQQVQCGI